MKIGKKAARKLAGAWLCEQPELPKKYRLETFRYDHTLEGRLFIVRYFSELHKRDFRLLEFYIKDDGSVLIRIDKRVGRQTGEDTEKRFFEAMQVRTEQTPPWFKKIERADLFFDLRGIDAFAFVEYREGERRLRIPIQIKSSKTGAKEYRERHPLCYEHGVVVIVVKSNRTDEQLRQHVYTELGRARKQKIRDGTRFTALHALLVSGRKKPPNEIV